MHTNSCTGPRLERERLTLALRIPNNLIHVQYSHLLADATGGYTRHKWFEKYSHLLTGATGG